jgi:putative PIN family toxin of toxin-antitoxin system
VTSVASPAVAAEWRAQPKSPSVQAYFRRASVEIGRLAETVENFIALSEMTEPIGEPPPCRDEKDRKYLHCAISGNVDFLVTTDLDLLVQEQIASTQIIRPGELWRLLFE